jgi:maltose O-acetyltransferase
MPEEFPDPNDSRSMRQRMLAGDLYRANDPELAAQGNRAAALMTRYNHSQPDERAALLKEILGSVGASVEIRPPMYIDYGYNIHIGPRTFINYSVMLLDVGRITIGADCQIGPGVHFLTPTHPLDPELRKAQWEAAQPITLADNVWLGGGVILCPGVSIGENTVVGAGSVVTKDLPANVLAVGNPARVIREL